MWKGQYKLGHSTVSPELRIEYCTRGCEPDEAYDIDIDPDDIDLTDHVTVVWGIR